MIGAVSMCGTPAVENELPVVVWVEIGGCKVSTKGVYFYMSTQRHEVNSLNGEGEDQGTASL